MPRRDIDAIIVGSGPAAVCAAFPLVEAGKSVLMVDSGTKPRQTVPRGDFYDIHHKDRGQWHTFIGSDYSAVGPSEASSPKFRAPTNRYVFSGYRERYSINTQDFVVTGSLSKGGLSNAWGAGISCFDARDLTGYPFGPEALDDSYGKIAQRIGISGAEDDLAGFHGPSIPLQPPLDLNRNASTLLRRYSSNPEPARGQGLTIGRARNAVLSQSVEDRFACEYCGMCIWGCRLRSIYSSASELPHLQRFDNFVYRDNCFVTALQSKDSNQQLRVLRLDDGNEEHIEAPVVILACGAVGSTKIVFSALENFDDPVPLLSNPVAAFALCLPQRLGTVAESRFFALSQLSFAIEYEDQDVDSYSYGNVFPSDGLLASELIRYLPLSFPASRYVARILMPAVLFGNCFFSSTYGQHTIGVSRDGEVRIRGRYDSGIDEVAGRAKRRLARTLMRYGAFLIPSSFKLARPGEDVHYAGSLPMKTNPLPHQLTVDGEVAGIPNVFVVDGAALPRLPAKPHTFTIMANADRIGRLLVERLSR